MGKMIDLDELVDAHVARPIRDFYADPEVFVGVGGVAMGWGTKWIARILSFWDQGQIHDDRKRFENYRVSSIVTRRRRRANWIRFIQDHEGRKRLFEATFLVDSNRVVVETFHLGLLRATARFSAHYDPQHQRFTLRSRFLMLGLVQISFRTIVLPRWWHQKADRRFGPTRAPETLLVIGRLRSVLPGVHGTFTAYLRRSPPTACASCPELLQIRRDARH